ncbi:MAG: AsmA family protein [Ekhidna sp.]|nr:AsmA family protein [Ekhidna sp.]
MKKLLVILGVVIFLLIVTIVAIPVIFKEDIRKGLDDAMAENLNASVYYDIDAFSLSLLKSFPDLTVSMSNFGIIGIDEFESDTLVSVGTFLITVDVMSAISGDQIQIEQVLLDQPRIKVLVLPDGKANYDIAKTTSVEEEPVEEASGGNVSIGIQSWNINGADVTYQDQSLNFYSKLEGLNHSGSGDFTLEVFDMNTKTTVDAASLGFEGVEYVANKRLNLDVNLNMDLGAMKFTFKENRVAVNQFAMEADGFVSMPGENIEMDISFGGKDINLTSILSLIPGVYQEYLDGVKAGGVVGFDGFVRGTFNENSMPAVAANLKVEDGSVSYAKFNIPIEKINIATSFEYPSADLTETSFNVDNFSMLVDGESVEAYLKFKNLEDYKWDFGFDGNADLEKIAKIIPMDGMTLAGKINAKLNSAGQMSYLEAEQYELLPTSGSLLVNDFVFKSEDLPQGFNLMRADLSFDPAKVNLSEFSAKSGNSDFSLQGKVENYIAFALSEGELLTGRLDFSSNLIDVNEFLPEEIEEDEEIDTTALEVIKIPENIDFTFASSIGKIAYSNMPITNFKGIVLVKDGAIILDKNDFEMLGGEFEMSGSYVTKDLEKPKYDLGFKIKDLSISRAFETFETVQSYVPIAEQVTGNFSADFTAAGNLGQDMMPIVEDLNLEGLVNVAEAALEKGAFIQKLSAVTSLKGGGDNQSAEKISVKDVLIQTAIRDGSLFVEPFDLNVGGQSATVGGSNTLDGKLNYSMLMKDVPTGQIGSAVNSALSSFTGGAKLVADKINLNLGIGGTYDDPTVKLLGTSDSETGESASASDMAKAVVSSRVNEEKEKAKEEINKKKEEQKQKIIAEAESQAKAIRSEGQKSAAKVKQEGYAAADKLIKEAGSNPIKKRVAETAAKKLRSEADQKAGRIESEANKKADQVVAEAKKKAGRI